MKRDFIFDRVFFAINLFRNTRETSFLAYKISVRESNCNFKLIIIFKTDLIKAYTLDTTLNGVGTPRNSEIFFLFDSAENSNALKMSLQLIFLQFSQLKKKFNMINDLAQILYKYNWKLIRITQVYSSFPSNTTLSVLCA